MTRHRLQGLIGLAAAIIAAAAVAIAAPAPAQAADNTPTARTCTIGALTDRVDGTNRISAGGWISCSGPVDPANPFAITVTLFRNGSRVAADANVCGPGVSGCYAATDYGDSVSGNQKWQAFVRVQGSASGTKWGNILYR